MDLTNSRAWRRARTALRVGSLCVLAGLYFITGAAAGEGSLQLSYKAYFAGVHAANLSLGVVFDAAAYDSEAAAYDLDATAYAVRVGLKTTGLVKALTRLKTSAYSHGALVSGDVVPVRAGYRSKKWWNKRQVELGFDQGTPKLVRMKPRRKGRKPPAISPTELHGALDPAGAFLAVLSRFDSGQGCDFRVPVFDGRRLYELVGEADGTGRLEASGRSPFSGPTVNCRMWREKKAGYKQSPGAGRERDHREAKLRMARVFDEMPPVPVHIAGDTRYGSFVAHLVGAKLDAGGVKRELRPSPGRKRRR